MNSIEWLENNDKEISQVVEENRGGKKLRKLEDWSNIQITGVLERENRRKVGWRAKQFWNKEYKEISHNKRICIFRWKVLSEHPA